MIFGYAPDPDLLAELVRSGSDEPKVRAALHIQNCSGEERLKLLGFDRDEDLTEFLGNLEKYVHLKAFLEIGGPEDMPFYVTWRLSKYGGSARYDPSLDR